MLGFTSIGACIENAVLAATAEGLNTDVEFASRSSVEVTGKSQVPIAHLRFSAGGRLDLLANYIAARSTVRRMNGRSRVAGKLFGGLEASCGTFPQVSVHWVKDEHLRDLPS